MSKRWVWVHENLIFCVRCNRDKPKGVKHHRCECRETSESENG